VVALGLRGKRGGVDGGYSPRSGFRKPKKKEPALKSRREHEVWEGDGGQRRGQDCRRRRARARRAKSVGEFSYFFVIFVAFSLRFVTFGRNARVATKWVKQHTEGNMENISKCLPSKKNAKS